MSGKSHSNEASDEIEEHVIGNLRRGPLYYNVAKNLAELCSCSCVLWNIEFTSEESRCLVEASSKQSVEDAVRLPLTSSKMQAVRSNLKTELLSKRKQNIKTWKIFSLSI